MGKKSERILIIENDQKVSEYLVHQALNPAGYTVEVATSATRAFSLMESFQPHVIISNLFMPELSAKDLLAAIAAQGLDIPVIVLSKEAEEGDILAAFRLGAVDFLLMPVRETEVLRVVERALTQVHLQVELNALRQTLAGVQKDYQDLSAGMAMLPEMERLIHSVEDLPHLLQFFLEHIIRVTDADRGMICLGKNGSESLYLTTMVNMPVELKAQLNKIWEDGLSTHWENFESLHIYGESLKPFILSNYGQAALIVPIHFRAEFFGSLILFRMQMLPFVPTQRQMASFLTSSLGCILMVYRLLHLTDGVSMEGKRDKEELIDKWEDTVKHNLVNAYETTLALLSEEGMLLNSKQKKMLYQINDNLLAILTEIPPFTSQPSANEN